MDEEDEVALKHINATLPRGVPECNEDLFEDVMNFFEKTAQNYLAIVTIAAIVLWLR